MIGTRALRGLATALVVGFVFVFAAWHATRLIHHGRTVPTTPTPSAQVAIRQRPHSDRVVVSFAPTFPAKDGLVTNEYAYWNPHQSGALHSPFWNVTSGSLFARAGAGWTGIPDTGKPNARSTNATGSAIFRTTSSIRAFDDVAVSFDLRNIGYVTTPLTPRRPWDGVHVFLHYRSQYALYYLSVNRRDNTATIKKKLPGGASNGGTYYSLAEAVAYHVPIGRWQHIRTTIRTNPDGSVTIQAFVNGRPLITTTDNGIGGPPLTGRGAVGIRGDNDNFEFAHLRVTQLP